jgi:hypothetical protein
MTKMAGASAAMTKKKPPRVLPLTLVCAQSLDSTLFFRGISFCSNGAGRVKNPTYANNERIYE